MDFSSFRRQGKYSNAPGTCGDCSAGKYSERVIEHEVNGDELLYRSRVIAPYNMSSTMTRGLDGTAGTETDGGVGG